MSNISDQYLDALEANTNLLTEEQKENLDNKGFIVIPNLIDTLWIKKLQIRFDKVMEAEGENAGAS